MYLCSLPTFVEEDTDGKAEVDGGDDVCEKEDEEHRRRGVADHAAILADRDAEEDSNDDAGDEEQQEVLEEPGTPVQPVAQSHHLHQLLKHDT